MRDCLHSGYLLGSKVLRKLAADPCGSVTPPRCPCRRRRLARVRSVEISTRQARVRRQRRALGADVQATSAAALAAHIWSLPEMRRAGVVGTFVADDGEVSLWPVVARLWAEDVAVTVPAIDDADRLVFLRWRRGGELVPGRFGIPIPACGEAIDVRNHDVILIAGVLFGPRGARVGRGRGYYDRALAFRIAPDAPAPADGPMLVGVGHLFQWDPQLVCRPQDVALDAFVSPAGVRRFGRDLAPWN
ncbi:MAG: 5-formyltetrahydrofolate cyclo-ligase [Acidimicrobiia bacterium]|nr:5-formyltetrahydrofolate cyclo-ligase [Acidimicrobiia bacterium]